MNLLFITSVLLQGATGQIADEVTPTSPVMISSPDSYYSEALRNRVKADVPVELMIDAQGKVIKCIALGDFDEGLKQASCDRMLQYSRFQPARDTQGKPISGRYNTNVQWGSHPNMRRHPLQTAREVEGSIKTVATYMVEADGQVSSCKGSISVGTGWRKFDEVCDDIPAKVSPYLDPEGKPSRRKIRMMIMLDNVAIDE